MNIPRSVALERLGYTLAAPALAIAPNVDPHGALNTVLLLAGATGAVGSVVAHRSGEGVGRKLVRLSPLVAALIADVVEQMTPGWCWGADLLIAAGWAVTGWHVLPLSRSARRNGRPALGYVAAPQLQAAPTGPVPAPVQVDDGASAFTASVRALWENSGSPGRTVVVKANAHQGMPRDLTMLLRAIEPGRPITGLTEEAIAAAFRSGVEPSDVRIMPVERKAGRESGPGWREVHVTPDASERRSKTPTDIEKWADKVARSRGGAPGSVLVGKSRDHERHVTFWRAKMEDPTELPRVDLAKVCRGMDIQYDDSCVFYLADGAEFLISVFDEPPLSRTFPATRELLTPDAKGMFVCGYTVTGQPVKNMVWQHDKNAACHGLILGVTRSGKTQYFAIAMAAESIAGAVIWLASCLKDEKTSVLGEYIDRQGVSPLYMLRQLRAGKALCSIRAEMPWDYDGKPHDYKPGDPRCPYRPLNIYCDEFMAASADPDYGAEIQALGDDLTVMGLKYGVGLKVAGQSPFAHNGFSTEMKDNLKQNSRSVIFNMGSPAATRKAAEGTMENPYDVPTIPARYSRSEGSVIERAMAGEADPENGISTGGVAVIVLDNGRATLMRSLYADFDTDLSGLFPETITRLTDHEIAELDKRGLWGDWSRPEDVEPDLDDFGDNEPRRDEVTSPRQALDIINRLSLSKS